MKYSTNEKIKNYKFICLHRIRKFVEYKIEWAARCILFVAFYVVCLLSGRVYFVLMHFVFRIHFIKTEIT